MAQLSSGSSTSFSVTAQGSPVKRTGMRLCSRPTSLPLNGYVFTGPQPPMREDSGQWVDVSIDNRSRSTTTSLPHALHSLHLAPSRNTSSRSTGVTPIKEGMSSMKLSSPQGPPRNVIGIDFSLAYLSYVHETMH